MAGKIIILNGTSSAGKSTVAKELKNMLNNYFLTSIDDFMTGLPDSLHGYSDQSDPGDYACHTKLSEDGRVILDFTITPKGYLWFGRFLKGIDAMCSEDVGIIFDMIVPDEKMLLFLADHLKNHEVYFVCIRCTEEIRKQREAQRGDRGVGMYLLNADYIYNHCRHDIEVDTSMQSAHSAALEIKNKLENIEPSIFKLAVNAAQKNTI